MNFDDAKNVIPAILTPEGYAYARGHAAARAGNLLEAQELWTIGADLGHSFSQGMLKALSVFDATKDHNLYWHEAAAELGDPQSMDVLGFLLEQAGDKQSACAQYQRAATLGSQHSMNRLGVLAAELGRFDEARAWWEASGDVIAFENLQKLGTRDSESPVPTADKPDT
jgi:tetratricopeptide (TPR) repeat protein